MLRGAVRAFHPATRLPTWPWVPATWACVHITRPYVSPVGHARRHPARFPPGVGSCHVRRVLSDPGAAVSPCSATRSVPQPCPGRRSTLAGRVGGCPPARRPSAVHRPDPAAAVASVHARHFAGTRPDRQGNRGLPGRPRVPRATEGSQSDRGLPGRPRVPRATEGSEGRGPPSAAKHPRGTPAARAEWLRTVDAIPSP